MDRSLYTATEEFVSLRITHHELSEKGAVTEANETLREAALRLRASLDGGQSALFKACEDAYAFADGETRYHYYKTGFGDALRFLLGWGGDLSETV